MVTFTDVQGRQVGTCGATGAAVNVPHLAMSRATFATMNVQLRYLSPISPALFIALLSSGIMWRHLGHQRRQKYRAEEYFSSPNLFDGSILSVAV